MKRLMLAALVLAPWTASTQDNIAWLNDLKQGMFEAKQTGKPLFIVFR